MHQASSLAEFVSQTLVNIWCGLLRVLLGIPLLSPMKLREKPVKGQCVEPLDTPPPDDALEIGPEGAKPQSPNCAFTGCGLGAARAVNDCKAIF